MLESISKRLNRGENCIAFRRCAWRLRPDQHHNLLLSKFKPQDEAPESQLEKIDIQHKVIAFCPCLIQSNFATVD